MLAIEQALAASDTEQGFQILARSSGFRDDWLDEARQLCAGFGNRPADAPCPLTVFARPFAGGHVAVVQVTDQDVASLSVVNGLAFRLLILTRPLYADLGGDPFFIADAFPPSWAERGEAATLAWTVDPPTRRTIAQLQKVLDVPNSATLLGGAQALLDGGRLVFERTSPAPQLIRALWSLLPTSTRSELWPATFAFTNTHGFHVLVVPRADGPDYEGYLFEEQAGDYPEGRYELALQIAVESGAQGDLDALLSRRSRRQTMRLGLILLAVFILVPLLGGLLVTPPRQPALPPAPAKPPASHMAPAKGMEKR